MKIWMNYRILIGLLLLAWLPGSALAQSGNAEFSTDTIVTYENRDSVVVEILRTGGNSGAVNVDLQIGGTAQNTVDFQFTTSSISWADQDQTPQQLSFFLLEDYQHEGAEFITLTLSNPSGGLNLGNDSILVIELNDSYHPASNVPGNHAMFKDSSAFVAWANDASVIRGPQDISASGSPLVTVGVEESATNLANAAVISLGDGGEATMTFEIPITNGPGYDFAIFENSFDPTFLELAFVEVSSNGQNFFRFPAISLTDTTSQVGGFQFMEPTNVHNLAGKYPALYGTPFDLDDLVGTPGLNTDSITHVKVIDVIGNIDRNFPFSVDSRGVPVNDPFPTPFPSCGFDLDAVGVIHTLWEVGQKETEPSTPLSIFPNPSQGFINIEVEDLGAEEAIVRLINVQGVTVLNQRLTTTNQSLDLSYLPKGWYALSMITAGNTVTQRLILK